MSGTSLYRTVSTLLRRGAMALIVLGVARVAGGDVGDIMYQWRPLEPSPSTHSTHSTPAALAIQSSLAPYVPVATWAWVPAVTFVRVRTSQPAAALRVIKVEVSEAGAVVQEVPAVAIDGGLGIWHMAGTGAYYGVGWREGVVARAGVGERRDESVAPPQVTFERAARRQAAYAVSQLRLGAWDWLWRGAARARLEPALLAGTDLEHYVPLLQWLNDQRGGETLLAEERTYLGRAIWSFLAARSLGSMASAADTQWQEMVPSCRLLDKGALELSVPGPAWVRVVAWQPVATWVPWTLRVASPREPAAGDVEAARGTTAADEGALVRGVAVGWGRPAADALVEATADGVEVGGMEVEELGAGSSPATPLASSSMVTQSLWLTAATTKLSITASSTVCVAVKARRLRRFLFTPALRDPSPIEAGVVPRDPTLAVVAQALADGSRILERDDPRRVAMWDAFYTLSRSGDPSARAAAIGMAALIAEQSMAMSDDEARRLVRLTSHHPMGAMALIGAARQAAVASAVALAAASSASLAASSAALLEEEGAPSPAGNSIAPLSLALAGAWAQPALPAARAALHMAWRLGAWRPLADMTSAPIAEAASVSVLTAALPPRSPPAAPRDAWVALPARGEGTLVVAASPSLDRRDVVPMQTWRLIARVAPSATTPDGGAVGTAESVAELEIDGQHMSLTSRDGVIVGEWLLPVGEHRIRWRSGGATAVAHDAAPQATLYSSLPVAMTVAAKATRPPPRVTSQRFTRLGCDQAWSVAAPAIPFLRMTAVAPLNAHARPASRLTVEVRFDDQPPQSLVFVEQGSNPMLGVAGAVTTTGQPMTAPLTGVIAVPAAAKRIEITCRDAPEVWLSLQERADAPAQASPEEEIERAIANLRLPDVSTRSLAALTKELRLTRSPVALAKRAYVWWMLGFGELAALDAREASAALATDSSPRAAAVAREARETLAALATTPSVVWVPAEHAAWARAPRLVAPLAGRDGECNDAVFGGDPKACLMHALIRYEEQRDWLDALQAARAYVAYIKSAAIGSSESAAMFAAATAALAEGYHPILQWARNASARGMALRMVAAVDESAGSRSFAVAATSRVADTATHAMADGVADGDAPTAGDARRLALDAPWTPAQGLIALDHGGGISLRLPAATAAIRAATTATRRVRIGAWCQVLGELATAAEQRCAVVWRLNQRPAQTWQVAARQETWQTIELPLGEQALAFDLVAPARDRLLGIVVEEHGPLETSRGGFVVGRSQQKAFRVLPGQPVSLRVAGPTVLDVEPVVIDGAGGPLAVAPAPAPAPAPVPVQITALGQALTASARAELPLLSNAPTEVVISADREAWVVLRLREGVRDVAALPANLGGSSQGQATGSRPTGDLAQYGVLGPIVPPVVQVPPSAAAPTFAARARVGIQREDQEDAALGSGGADAAALTSSAGVLEARFGLRKRLEHELGVGGTTWLALDGLTREYDRLPLSYASDLTVETRWSLRRLHREVGQGGAGKGALGLRIAGRYAYATTGIPAGTIVLGQQPHAHIGRLAVEAYGMWTPRRWLVRPSVLYRANWADAAAATDVDPVLWNVYLRDMPTWYEGAALVQWAPSLDSRVSLTPRVRLADDTHPEHVSARLRLSGLFAQRRWGGVYMGVSWLPQYWFKHADAILLRLDPYFTHQTAISVDLLRQWRRQWWFTLGFRASVQYAKGQRDIAGWVSLDLTKSWRPSLEDVLPSEREFDQLTSGRIWADEN